MPGGGEHDEVVEVQRPRSNMDDWMRAFFAHNDEKQVTTSVFSRLVDYLIPEDVHTEAGHICKVIDLGCGDGTLSVEVARDLKRKGLNVVYKGVDKYLEFVTAVREKFFHLEGVESEFITGDCFAEGSKREVLDKLFRGVNPTLILMSHSGYYAGAQLGQFLDELVVRSGPDAVILMIHGEPMSEHIRILSRYEEIESSGVSTAVTEVISDFVHQRSLVMLEVLFNSFIFFGRASRENYEHLLSFLINKHPSALGHERECQFRHYMQSRLEWLRNMIIWARMQIVVPGCSAYLRSFDKAVRRFSGYRDAQGFCPLHWAAFEGNEPVVRDLVVRLSRGECERAKAVVNVVNLRVLTPVYMAVLGHCFSGGKDAQSYLEIIKFLVDAGARRRSMSNELMPLAAEFPGVSCDDIVGNYLTNQEQYVMEETIEEGVPVDPLLSLLFLKWVCNRSQTFLRSFGFYVADKAIEYGKTRVLDWILDNYPELLLSSTRYKEENYLSLMAIKGNSSSKVRLKKILKWASFKNPLFALQFLPTGSIRGIDLDDDSSIYCGFLLSYGTDTFNTDSICIEGINYVVGIITGKNCNSFFNAIDHGLRTVGVTTNLVGSLQRRCEVTRLVKEQWAESNYKQKQGRVLNSCEQNFMAQYEDLCWMLREGEEIDDIIELLVWVMGIRMKVEIEIYYPNGFYVPFYVETQNTKIRLRYSRQGQYDLILSQVYKEITCTEVPEVRTTALLNSFQIVERGCPVIAVSRPSTVRLDPYDKDDFEQVIISSVSQHDSSQSTFNLAAFIRRGRALTKETSNNEYVTVACALTQFHNPPSNLPQFTSLCRQAIAIGGMSLANLLQELGATDHGSGWDTIFAAVEQQGALQVLYTLQGIDVVNQTFTIVTPTGESKLLEVLKDKGIGQILESEIKDDPNVLHLPSIDPLEGHFHSLMKEIGKATIDQVGYFMQKVSELIHQAVEHIAPEEQTDQQATIMDLLIEMFEHLGTQDVPFPGYSGKKPDWPDDFGGWGRGDGSQRADGPDGMLGMLGDSNFTVSDKAMGYSELM